MFTVKWVSPGGEEHVAGAAGDLRYEAGSLFFTDSAGGERVWMGPGTAYVMNAAGQTVAKYELGARPAAVPRGVQGAAAAMVGMEQDFIATRKRDAEALQRAAFQRAKDEKTKALEEFVATGPTRELRGPNPPAQIPFDELNAKVDNRMDVVRVFGDPTPEAQMDFEILRAAQKAREDARRHRLSLAGQQVTEAGGRHPQSDPGDETTAGRDDIL